MCPGSQPVQEGKQPNWLVEKIKLRAGQRKEGKLEVPPPSPSEKLRPCCPRGNGALPRIAKHGRDGADGEIIKSIGWNDRMNRKPTVSALCFDCRVLSGPLAGPRHEAVTTCQSPSISRPRPSLRPSPCETNLFSSFRATVSVLAIAADAITIYQYPTPIIIIIVIPGTGAMFRLPPTRTEQVVCLCTRHGTVRTQRSIVNVASTWIHLDQHRWHSLGLLHTQHRMPCGPQSSICRSLSLQTSSLSATLAPPLPSPSPLRVLPPTRMQGDLCPERQDERRHRRRQQHRLGASLIAAPQAKPSRSRWPYCPPKMLHTSGLRRHTHTHAHRKTLADCPVSVSTSPIEC